jgi:soluble lytic murein transglycosylase-like protein
MFEDLIASAAVKFGVRAELIAAVIHHESGGDPNAVGDGGRALGLMQMHRQAAEDVGFAWEDLRRPEVAIPAGAAYLSQMLRLCGNSEAWALAAYNQGPTVIHNAKRYSDAVMGLLAA